jgi:hypothetical protein
MDKSPKILSETECFFLLNHERALNSDGSKRGSLGKGSPMVANRIACDMEQPAGENYTVGKYYCNLTNELYSWVINNNNVHYIQRINGDGTCEVVYHGCLRLNAAPKHSIEQWRAYLKLDKLCANRHGKALVWVDGTDFDIGMIDVDASIATESFTTPFFDICGDPCELIKMCVPDPCGCLNGDFVPWTLPDAGKSNFITDIGIKISYRHVYYDGRASIWSEPTKPFYQDTKGCFDSSDGFPRCIKLRVPIGNPLVDKIEIGVWKNGTFSKYDTVDKYKKYNSTQQYWYERELSEEVQSSYSPDDCAFDYVFCNDKQCEPISIEEFNRVYNPSPREPQGFFPIGLSNLKDTALAFYNYKQGNCPVDKFEIDKFDIGLNCPNDTCETEFTTLIAYAVVHNREHNRNQPIFRLGGDAANSPDDSSDPAYFGGLNKVGSGSLELGHGQTFKDKVRNFIAYSEGTDYWSEMKQWKADPGFVNKEEWGTLAHFDDNFEKNRWRRAIGSGQFFYQRMEIKVPKGTRGFLRLSSHQATGNEQGKSTFVIGILNNIRDYSGTTTLSSGNTDFENEEIYFDTCGLDTLELSQAFVIDDNAIDAGLTQASTSYSGYVTDGNNLPVEGAVVTYGSTTSKTDFNGFYHFYIYPGNNDSIDVEVLVERDCGAFSSIKTQSMSAELGTASIQDINIDNEPYRDGLFATVKVKVQDCNENSVSGIRVALSGSKYKVSGTDGFAVFKIRNYQSRDRTVKAILLNKSGCFNTTCQGDCNSCASTSFGGTPECYQTEPVVELTSLTLNTESIISNKNGLKSAGLYEFGFIVRGSCGRISAVNKVKSIEIPRVQERNRDGFCSFTYNGNDITLPSWAKCIDIVRSENLNSFLLQWLVDKIERTDDGKIKLTIQSLNDYNEKYFFKTNTVYQWLKGDRVEFIKNGDGKIFSIAQYGLLNYLTISPFNDEQVSGETEQPADFFNQLIIEDDGKLNDLKKGAVIELQRPKDCTIEPVYFGICVSIPVGSNGKLLYDSGTFRTFDTYYVNRKIGEFPSQQFEHRNPSDFWGDNINPLTDAGRPYFINKFENEQRYGRNITINSPTEYNRFGDFVKRLDPSTHGDIIAIGTTDNKTGLCISEFDWSIFGIEDNLLRLTAEGMVRAASPDQVISDSQSKLSGAFGCQYGSIGSIFFGDGFAMFIDINRAHYIKHNYDQATAIDIGKCQRYFRKRCQEIETFNRANADPLNQYRFATGMNYQSGAVHLTIKSLRDSGVNNEAGPFLKRNETIMFDPETEDFLGFCSATPEAFGRLDIFDGAGCSMIMFLNGIPYITPIIPDRWNEFFGIATDWIIGISLNKEENKLKRPLAIEVQSETMFFVKEVTTDRTNFRSEIPPIKIKRMGNKDVWNGAFLGNVNSREGLFGNEKPSGYWCNCLLIRDNTNGLVYNSISNEKRIAYSEIDLITSKSAIIEEAGMQANL